MTSSLTSCKDNNMSWSTPYMTRAASTIITAIVESITSKTDASLNVSYGYSDTKFKIQLPESGVHVISSMY